MEQNTKLCITTIVILKQRMFFSLPTLRTWSLMLQMLIIFNCCLFTKTGSTFLDYILVDFFAGSSLWIEQSKQTKTTRETATKKLKNSTCCLILPYFFSPNLHKVNLYNGHLSNSTSCSSL